MARTPYTIPIPPLRPALLAALLALGALSACDSSGPTESSGPDESLPPEPLLPTVTERAEPTSLAPRMLNLSLSPEHLQLGRWFESSTLETSPLYAANLLLSGTRDGTSYVAGGRYFTNFGPCDGSPNAVFALDADTTYSAEGWPAAFGAPVDGDGHPLVYGDEMVWATTCATTPSNVVTESFPGLRVNAAVFGHDDYEHVIFVRYELINEGSTAITDAYTGFWTDPDLMNVHHNLVGIDRENRLGYVYMSPEAEDRGVAAGSVFLELPGGSDLAAHRILNKHDDERFGEGSLDADPATTFPYTLRGLDHLGDPMIDPTTGEASTFAYTGDPVAGTGWLDGFDYCDTYCNEDGQTGEEVRQFTSAGPFRLEPGAATTFTIAYVYQAGQDLASALANLKNSARDLRERPTLWQFPTSR